MQKLFVLVFLCVALINAAYAQDTIKRIDRRTITSKVDSVGLLDIYYRSAIDHYRQHRTISKGVVADIAYENGRKDILFVMNGKGIDTSSPMLHLPDSVMYQLGRHDAKRYYSGYKGAYIGTLLATFPGSPAAGLITGIACSATPPNDRKLDCPNVVLADKATYRDGYATKARSIKKGKVWTAFGIGVILNVAVFAIFLSH